MTASEATRRWLALAMASAMWSGAQAQPIDTHPDAAARAMISSHVGSYDIKAFLAEPSVRAELQTLAGRELQTIEDNLAVTGPVEFIGGALAVRGNAPHQGGEHAAVVCLQPLGTPPQVHAAVLERGAITIFTRQARYDFLPLCIRDWVTVVNAGPAARTMPARNVRLLRPQLR